MFRQTSDRLCQLCPKGEFSDTFGSPFCARCPAHHTTRGLGSRKSSHCYYHRQANTANIVAGRSSQRQGVGGHTAGGVGSGVTGTTSKRNKLGFMYYNRWMTKPKTAGSHTGRTAARSDSRTG